MSNELSYEIDPTISIQPEWLEDWMDDAYCLGKWEEFDSARKGVARQCWDNCSVRAKCLMYSLDWEASVNAHTDIDGIHLVTNDFERTGIRGGYTPSEREYIYQIVVTDPDPGEALYQFI